MDIQQLVLTANQRVALRIPGRFFMLVESAGPLDIGFEKNGSPTGEVGRGVEAGYARFPGDWRDQEDRFDGVFFDSPTAQTIRIGISFSAADYRRVVGVVQVQSSTTAATLTSVSPTVGGGQLIAANPQRLAVILQNNADPGGGVVRVMAHASNNPGLAPPSGHRLQPGQSVTFATQERISAILETVGVEVAITEILK